MRQRAERVPSPAAAPGAVGWLRERLLPRGAGALMLAAYTMILTALVSFILARRDLPPGLYYGGILLLSAMFALHVVWPDITARIGQRRAVWAHLLANGAIFLAVLYLDVGGSSFSFLPFLLFMLCAQAVVDLPGRAAAAYICGLSLAYLGVLVLRGLGPGALAANVISAGLGLVFTVLFARALRLVEQERERAERLLTELRAANLALAAARGRELDLAAAEERVRLARDIHDGLGHHLTALNVQLQAAAKLVERDPARAARTIAICREEAQAALEEVRQSVAAMRRSPLDGRSLSEAIAALVRDFARASPIRAEFTLSGEPRELEPAAAMTLYRAAQEGLTNAQKHAGAASVAVELAFAPGSTAMRVRDDGPSLAAPAPGVVGGFGLAGLGERAERLGGRFAAGPAPGGGFLLELEIPL